MTENNFSWPDGSKMALSIVVNVEEGAEMNIRDGDPGPEPVDELSSAPRKPIRMHVSESNYQYGINAGAPRVLQLLKEYQMPATFTAAALALERAPDLASQIIDQGHEVCCHGYRWVMQYKMNEDQEREFIRKGIDSITRTCGERPVGWLSRYMTTDATRRLLAEEGFEYHMDDFSNDVPFWDSVETHSGENKPIVVLPYALDTNDMKMWMDPSLQPWDWAKYACDTFDWLHEEAQQQGARYMSLGVHLRIIGRPARITAFKQFLDHVKSKSDVCVMTRRDISRHFAAQIPAKQTS